MNISETNINIVKITEHGLTGPRTVNDRIDQREIIFYRL